MYISRLNKDDLDVLPGCVAILNESGYSNGV